MVKKGGGIKIIIETLQLGESLTSTEKNIAKFILENPLKLKDMSTEELAKATYSSPATIVRLSKKVGQRTIILLNFCLLKYI
ncbi:MurR/RpiR family transcriptional regulator [Mammaliicoccus lentus]|uniref:MurR/RpiR family transcriptional regulator n=1 Tax=Mammaliicoccus lentus TaxID=42858 RepID=UPI003447F6CD